MEAIRQSHRFGRLLAVWLLLWFISMSAGPLGPMFQRAALSYGSAAEYVAADNTALQALEHEHHRPELAAQPGDLCTGSQADVHAGHGTGSQSHCPLCLHCAAPPPAAFAQILGADAPFQRPALLPFGTLHVRSDAPAPPRGPPVLS